MSLNRLLFAALLFLFVQPLTVAASQSLETVTTQKDQQAVAVTIYNNDRALIKDHRRLTLPRGQSVLAFREVSAKMEPETALLIAPSLKVLEQNFEFDLLSPQSLLGKYLGRTVRVVRSHPTTGEETSEPAVVLSTYNGVVLKMADHIETGIPGRLIFPDVPANLRDEPTLTMLVDNHANGQQEMELSYLTTGLDWKADYVADLNDSDTACDIRGWVTLTNRSGTSYRDAHLQLVAGDVRQAERGEHRPRLMAKEAGAEDTEMRRQELFEYHLYSLDRPTTITDNQTKQVALLAGTDVPCRKEFVLAGQSYYYAARQVELGRKSKVAVYLATVNSTKNHLGFPFPKGVVRVYKKDGQSGLQFIGEDRIDHTPENGEIRLQLGNAFDVTADRVQTDFKKLAALPPYHSLYEAAFAITLHNAKNEPVTVQVKEPIPGDWQMVSESHRHQKTESNTAAWSILVPAKGSVTLSYRTQVKM